MRTILIAGGYPHHLPNEIVKAFSKAGWSASFFDSSPESPWHRPLVKPLRKLIHNLRIQRHPTTLDNTPLSNLGWRSRRWLCEVERLRPDVALILRGNRFAHPWLSQAMKLTPHYCWMLEPMDRLGSLMEEVKAGSYRKILAYSKQEVDQLREVGIEAEFYPHYAAETPAEARVKNLERKYQWSFLGSHSPWREEVLRALLQEFPKAYIQGPRWNRVAKKDAKFRKVVHEAYFGKEEAFELYLNCSVGIDLSTGPGLNPNGITMRVPELLACGCPVFTQESPEWNAVPWEWRGRVEFFVGVEDLLEGVRVRMASNQAGKEAELAWKIAQGVSGYEGLVRAVELSRSQ